MASRGQPLRIGPFSDGLNTAVDASAIADTEMSECNNFEVDLDGTLVARPAIEEAESSNATGLVIIGRGMFPGGQGFLFGSKSNENSTDTGVYVFDGNTWKVLDSLLVSSVAIQHSGFVWFVPRPGTKSTRAGGRWDPANGFVVDNNMPEGEGAIFYKSRMFITPGPSAVTNTSRLYFTDNITSSTLSWPASNIIDVSPGDGQNLMDLVVLNDNVLLFKSDSTYVLAYDTNPSTAIIRTVNPTIGVSDRFCLQSYENSVFTLHQGRVYEILNFDYDHLNVKVPFEIDTTMGDEDLAQQNAIRLAPTWLGKLGDRLIVGYFSKFYVYGLKTKTWSTWSSDEYLIHTIGPIWEFPTDIAEVDNPVHFSCSASKNESRTYRIYPKPSYTYDSYMFSSIARVYVPIKSTFTTKVYDFADSTRFKKLYWWGVDMIGENATGTVIPYVATTSTWSDVSSSTWSSLADNPYMQPLNTSGVTQTAVTQSVPSMRTFVKFPKTLRFRMLQFKVSIEHTGSVLEGPVRVFSLTAIVNAKQVVPKQVN